MRTKLLLILIVFTVLTQLCTVSAFAVSNGEKNKGSILQDQCTAWNAPPEGRGNRLPANARTTNDASEAFRRLERYHGVDPNVASDRLHEIKRYAHRGPADNVLFDMTGNVFDPRTREWLGTLTR